MYHKMEVLSMVEQNPHMEVTEDKNLTYKDNSIKFLSKKILFNQESNQIRCRNLKAK